MALAFGGESALFAGCEIQNARTRASVAFKGILPGAGGNELCL